MRIIFYLLFAVLISSCSNSNLGSDYKSKNGLYICQITSTQESLTSCDNYNSYDSYPPFNWAKFGNDDTDNLFSNSIFLIGKEIQCNSEIEFFPVATLELKSELVTEKIVIGIPSNTALSEKEITTFFQFQMSHSQEMSVLTTWIESEYNLKWIATRWQDEIDAKSHLERIIKKF